MPLEIGLRQRGRERRERERGSVKLMALTSHVSYIHKNGQKMWARCISVNSAHLGGMPLTLLEFRSHEYAAIWWTYPYQWENILSSARRSLWASCTWYYITLSLTIVILGLIVIADIRFFMKNPCRPAPMIVQQQQQPGCWITKSLNS